MDIDGLQKQLQDHEFIRSNILQLSQQKSMQIENEWNISTHHKTNSVIKFDIDEGDENFNLKLQIEHFQQKVAKLELDLKREKDIKHVKYYRADRKANEIKRLIEEKDDVIKKCITYESAIKDFESKYKLIHNECIQLEESLNLKITEWDELNNKIIEITERNNKTKPKHLARIQELEWEIDELKQLIKSFEIVSKKNTIPDSTKDVLEKLSVMLLNKNTDPNFFSEQQKTLIRSLFGDYATITYKDKINELVVSSTKQSRDKFNAVKDLKVSLEKTLFFVNILCKISDKIDQPNFEFNRHTWSQLIPNKETLIDDKITLVERIASIEKWLNKEEIVEESDELSSFLNTDIQSHSKLGKDLFSNTNNSFNFE